MAQYRGLRPGAEFAKDLQAETAFATRLSWQEQPSVVLVPVSAGTASPGGEPRVSAGTLCSYQNSTAPEQHSVFRFGDGRVDASPSSQPFLYPEFPPLT